MPSGLGLEGYANIYSVGFATDKLITLEDGPGPHVYSYIAMVRDLNHPHALPIFTWENLEHTIVARRTVAQAAVHERENDQSRHWLNRMQASWTDFKKRNKTFTRLKNTGVERLRTGEVDRTGTPWVWLGTALAWNLRVHRCRSRPEAVACFCRRRTLGQLQVQRSPVEWSAVELSPVERAPVEQWSICSAMITQHWHGTFHDAIAASPCKAQALQ